MTQEKREKRANYIKSKGYETLLREATSQQLKEFACNLLGHGQNAYTNEEREAFAKSDDFLITYNKDGFVKYEISARFYDWTWHYRRIIVRLDTFRHDERRNPNMLWQSGKPTPYPHENWYIWDALIPQEYHID